MRATDRNVRSKRCRGRGKDDELIRKRQYIVEAKTAANRCFSLLEGIPGHSDARFEVAQRWIVKIRIAGVRLRVGNIAQHCQLALYLGRNSHNLIAQAQIKCEVRP